MRPFSWERLIGAGLGVMGLSARDFWMLSLPEWRALCAARFPQTPSLHRSGLDQLMTLHPDTTHGQD